ncbi:hypothetical protein GE061_003229 [Apolygus lucorum]|uniref:Retrotransposon gag domain-containing protein n=1 Tax=Apolygus lucorum TaxID=248454 RepID=A0A6A4JBV2_APOLU|nr:hypothetical protein GE061_003229 [Apolygus lucorum]
MTSTPSPKLVKFDSETLMNFHNRAAVHFARHNISDPNHQAYDFITALPDSDFRRVTQSLLPKTIDKVKWDDLKDVIQALEGADKNRRRLEFANLKRAPGQPIREFADALKALSLQCGWEEVNGGEAVRQLKFLTSFTETHILQHLMNLDDDDNYEDMVKIACEQQAIFDNASLMSNSAAPVSSNNLFVT